MNEFLKGFQRVTGETDPASVWAAFSRQMSDQERADIEAGGYDEGLAEGYVYLAWAESN